MKIPKQFERLFMGKTDFLIENTCKYLFRIMISAAKKGITRRWLHTDPPMVEEWLDTINDIYQMEKITHLVKLQMDKFSRSWSKWETFKKSTL